MCKCERRHSLDRNMRSSMVWIVVLLMPIFSNPRSARGADRSGDVERGRQLYWHGLTRSGAPFTCSTGNGIALSGAQLSCVSCHRPSGFGASEGGKYVPPITGPILFAPRELNRNRIFYKLFKEAQPAEFSARLREPRMRPAYSEASLARAIRSGVDPANQVLDPEMPRCALNESDMKDLVAYLKTLSAARDPGVNANVVHLATIVSDEADPARRDAVLNTIRAFFNWMNTKVEGNRSRGNYSPYYHSDFKTSFQRWQLHVWELHGPPSTWNEQIRAQYKQQPVFAVVSGLVQGPWEPIARFCDAERVPCIFPNTELPRTSKSEYAYSIYFSRGLELEAQALAHFMADKKPHWSSIIQIHSSGVNGIVPADAFARAARNSMPGIQIRDEPVSTDQDMRNLIHHLGSEEHLPEALVLWPGSYSRTTLAALVEQAAALKSRIKLITLPEDALEIVQEEKTSGLPANVLYTYPYELPSVYYPRVFRVRQWMHSRNIDIAYPRLQYQTYYALTMVQYGLDEILEDYYRDYLVEAIEHEAESHLDNGTHPALALGPGQRFASKGAYVVKIDPEAQGGIRAVSDWIVP